MTLSALLVCTDKAAAEVLSRVLNELSIRVESCPDFVRGSIRAAQERYDVIIADGQSSGGYDHYFNTFLRPTDLIWALLQVILQGFTIMLIHTYYGFNAFGGPAGVGEATGRAVRTSMVAAVFITTVSALALYGRSGDFHLSG